MIYGMTTVSLHTCKVLWTGYITYSQVWISSKSTCECVYSTRVSKRSMYIHINTSKLYIYMYVLCTHNDIQYLCVCNQYKMCACQHVHMEGYVCNKHGAVSQPQRQREINPPSHQVWGSFFPICWVWWLMVISCGLDPFLRLMFKSREKH